MYLILAVDSEHETQQNNHPKPVTRNTGELQKSDGRWCRRRKAKLLYTLKSEDTWEGCLKTGSCFARERFCTAQNWGVASCETGFENSFKCHPELTAAHQATTASKEEL